MTQQEAIIQLTSLAGQKQNEVDALNVALDLLNNGYKADQAANAATIQAFKDSVTAVLAATKTDTAPADLPVG